MLCIPINPVNLHSNLQDDIITPIFRWGNWDSEIKYCTPWHADQWQNWRPTLFNLKDQKCLSTKRFAMPWFQNPTWSIYVRTKSLMRIPSCCRQFCFPFLHTDGNPAVLCGNKRPMELQKDFWTFWTRSCTMGFREHPVKGLKEFLKVSLLSFSSSHPSDHRVSPNITFIWNRPQPFRLQSHLCTFFKTMASDLQSASLRKTDLRNCKATK